MQPDPPVRDLLRRRGPDSLGHAASKYTARTSQAKTDGKYLTFVSTVLSLRGSRTVTQPVQDSEASSILCWNGEAWSIGKEPTSGNDTAAIFDLLRSAIHSDGDLQHSPQEPNFIAEALSTVAGPYAFVFYSGTTGKLYFGRDFLGRRSLLYKVTDHGLLLTSVTSGASDDGGWSEVEADGIYCLDLENQAGLAESSDQEAVQWGGWLVSRRPYRVAVGSDESQNSSVGVV